MWCNYRGVVECVAGAGVVLVAMFVVSGAAMGEPPADEIVLSGELGEGWVDRLLALPKVRKLTMKLPENLDVESVSRLAGLQGLEVFSGEGFPMDSPLSDAVVKALAEIDSLRSLSLEATGVTDEGMGALAGMSLTDLSLRGEERLGDEALGHVAAIDGLEKLVIHSTPVSAEGLRQLQACRGLKELSLVRVICNKDKVEAVAGIESLEALTLCRVGYSDLAVLQNLKGLRSLRLLYSGASKTSESLGELTQLKTVRLEDCDIRNETPEEVKAKLAEVGIEFEYEVVESDWHDDVSGEVNEATRLARRAHASLASASDFPAFWVKWRTQAGEIPSMGAERMRSIRLLKHALKAEADMMTYGREEITFAWSPGQFFVGTRSYMPKEPENVWRAVKFGTKEWAWAHEQRNEKPPRHYLRAGAAKFAESMRGLHDTMRVTPKEFWWGDNSHHNLSTSSVPIGLATYRELPSEEFAGERCRVVESAARSERLWISEKTGRVRGHLDYIHQGYSLPFTRTDRVAAIVGRRVSGSEEYRQLHSDGVFSQEQKERLGAAWGEYVFGKNSYPSTLRVFTDYREVAEGRWFPFHVMRAGTGHNREDDNLYRYYLSESRVEEVRTDRADLSPVWEPYLPTEGSYVQDQRFEATVEYDYREDRKESEILEMVNAKLLEQAEVKRRLEELTAPVQEMVGKPAPVLPEENWVGERPDLAGKAYLLHFWAVWCGPCKNDVPLLNSMSKYRTVIGVHPSGTSLEEVAKAVEDEEMKYPTVVAGENSDGILGYPVKMFPYCIEVDEKGKVVKHGSLREILE